MTWRERERMRTDPPPSGQRLGRDGKRSAGPAVLEEVLVSVQAFLIAASNLERHAGIVVVAVADSESAIVHPRADRLQAWLSSSTNGSGGGGSATAESIVTMDPRRMQQDLITGIAQLVAQAANKAALNPDPSSCRCGGLAAGLSRALCLINRFLVRRTRDGVLRHCRRNITWIVLMMRE